MRKPNQNKKTFCAMNAFISVIHILEVQRTDSSHFLVEEMERWRGIIGEDFDQSKKLIS